MKPLEGEEIQIAVRQGALSASRRMTTGPGGKLVLEGLGPGTYGLTFRHRDYLPLEAMVAIPRDLGRGLVLVFEEGLRAQGEVRDPEDRPLPGAVLIWTPSGHPDRPLEAVADAKGSYRIGGLEPGSYLVRAFHADLRAAREGPDRKVTVSEGTANRFDFVEDLGATLAVRVLDKEGLPVPGLLVRFALRTERRGLSGFLRPTDREGKSTLRGLPGAGSLVLEAQGPRGGSGGRPGRVEIDLGALPPEVRLAVE